MVSQRGIEANPEKIKALIEMLSPRTVKEVQRLTGRVAAFNRFVSRATDKCLPFFKVLRQTFEWTAESEEAFQQLKQCMANPSLIFQVLLDETLFLYLAVSNTVVSAALIRLNVPFEGLPEDFEKWKTFVSRSRNEAVEDGNSASKPLNLLYRSR